MAFCKFNMVIFFNNQCIFIKKTTTFNFQPRLYRYPVPTTTTFTRYKCNYMYVCAKQNNNVFEK